MENSIETYNFTNKFAVERSNSNIKYHDINNAREIMQGVSSGIAIPYFREQRCEAQLLSGICPGMFPENSGNREPSQWN